jgi:hypothetical protein
MTEDNINKVLQMNQKLLIVMGYTTAIILQSRNSFSKEDQIRLNWIIEAIDNIIDTEIPLRPMP